MAARNLDGYLIYTYMYSDIVRGCCQRERSQTSTKARLSKMKYNLIDDCRWLHRVADT